MKVAYPTKPTSCSIPHQLSYFNISWLSENDGPGKRVVLFLQGCPLDCAWCHSPHSQPKQSPLLYFPTLCTNCQQCKEACTNNVHTFINNQHHIQRDKCIHCGKCIQACPQSSIYKQGNALSLPTKSENVNKLFEKLRPQLEMLKNIGGITFSGGEPLLQVTALTKLAKKCKENGFNTALESSGIVPIKSVEAIAPYIDTWLFGMRLTTGTNKIPHNYLEYKTRKVFEILIQQKNSKVIIRIPAIAGYTDTPEYLHRIQGIIENSPKVTIDVLPQNIETHLYYNAMGISPTLPFSKPKAKKAYEIITECFITNKILHHEE